MTSRWGLADCTALFGDDCERSRAGILRSLPGAAAGARGRKWRRRHRDLGASETDAHGGNGPAGLPSCSRTICAMGLTAPARNRLRRLPRYRMPTSRVAPNPERMLGQVQWPCESVSTSSPIRISAFWGATKLSFRTGDRVAPTTGCPSSPFTRPPIVVAGNITSVKVDGKSSSCFGCVSQTTIGTKPSFRTAARIVVVLGDRAGA